MTEIILGERERERERERVVKCLFLCLSSLLKCRPTSNFFQGFSENRLVVNTALIRASVVCEVVNCNLV